MLSVDGNLIPCLTLTQKSPSQDWSCKDSASTPPAGNQVYLRGGRSYSFLFICYRQAWKIDFMLMIYKVLLENL